MKCIGKGRGRRWGQVHCSNSTATFTELKELTSYRADKLRKSGVLEDKKYYERRDVVYVPRTSVG